VRLALALVLAVAAAACTSSTTRAPEEPGEARATPARGRVLRGKAVYYGGKWHGRKTASGERFNKHAMTAAHRSLPLGTRVRVTNLANGRSLELRINDRGPWGKDKSRIIDVSEDAARKLGFFDDGVTRVTVEVLESPRGAR
jgi:rare lipoprotein A